MKKNIGTIDMIIRLIIAAVIGFLFFANFITGVLAYSLIALAVVLLLTSFIRFCPLYWPFGINTCPSPARNKKSARMNSAIIAIVAGTFSLLSFTACSDDDTNTDDSIQDQAENNIQSGTWHISKFIDSGTDEAYHFTGYNFSFNSSGVLNASNGTNSYNGTWSITDSNSNDDSQDDLDFNIYFNLTNEFEELNDDWDFISQSSTKIELIDVSGGNGGTDYLTFEKN